MEYMRNSEKTLAELAEWYKSGVYRTLIIILNLLSIYKQNNSNELLLSPPLFFNIHPTSTLQWPLNPSKHCKQISLTKTSNRLFVEDWVGQDRTVLKAWNKDISKIRSYQTKKDQKIAKSFMSWAY